MLKNKSFLTARNTLLIFAVTMLYCLIKNFDYSVSGLYVLFIGDFSIAIAPRFLIGSILSLFKESFTVEWVLSFLKISTFVLFFFTAVYTADCLSHVRSEHSNIMIVLTGIFILFPFSITIFAGDIFGFIDLFCMAVLILCAFFAESRYLVWTFPILICAGIFIHDAYITAYMAPCFGILAYCVIRKYGKKLWASICFVVSAIFGFATTAYRFFFSTDSVKMTETEAISYLAQKGNCSEEFVSGYIEAFLYGKDVHNFSGIDYADNTAELLKHMIRLAVDLFSKNDLIKTFSIIPLLILFAVIWITAIRNTKGFFERLPYILFMLTILPQAASLLISVDISRFLAPIIFVQFIYLFMCIKHKDENVTVSIEKLKNKPQYLFVPILFTLILNII